MRAVHLLQIWILPDTLDLEPGYEQKAFTEDERRGRLRLIASNDGRDGSVTVRQDVSLFASIFGEGQSVNYAMNEARYGWIQVARGTVTVNGERTEQGDGAIAMGESSLEIVADQPSEILFFDLA
jgi:redox-sensitive bicupin YhaK (pirin superfamily)